MTVFAIVNVSEPASIQAALAANFAGDFVQISPAEWLVAARGATAKEISDRLGITDGKNGSAIIFAIAGYFGRASSQIWEWLAAKIAQF